MILTQTLTSIENIQALLPEFERLGLDRQLILTTAFNDAIRTYKTGKDSISGIEIYTDILSLRPLTNNDVDKERFAMHYRDLYDNVLDMVYDDDIFTNILDNSRNINAVLPIVVEDTRIRIMLSSIGALG